jgi:hypothetical protein
MATRFVKGKARTETPRMKDLPAPPALPEASSGRASGGRFAPGNRIGIGRDWKASIRKMLGTAVGDTDACAVVCQARLLYVAMLRSLPSDGPAVRQLLAAQARHASLATFYANEAARVGLATPDGLRLAEAARSHDTTAQRLA